MLQIGSPSTLVAGSLSAQQHHMFTFTCKRPALLARQSFRRMLPLPRHFLVASKHLVALGTRCFDQGMLLLHHDRFLPTSKILTLLSRLAALYVPLAQLQPVFTAESDFHIQLCSSRNTSR
jgi:hypothetical protein